MIAVMLVVLSCAHEGKDEAMRVSRSQPVGPKTTVTAVVHAPIQKVLDYTVAEDVLPKVLKRYGPVPAISGTEVLHGPWGRVGADRTVKIDGGGTLHEQITHFEAPGYFAYRIDQFAGTPLKGFAKGAVGSWEFTDLGGGDTRVEWTYSFEPTSALTTPIAGAFASTFYRGFMKQALQLIKEGVETKP